MKKKKKAKDAPLLMEDMQMTLLTTLALVGYMSNHVIPALQAIGAWGRPRNTYLDGFTCVYVSCIEHNLLYVRGYKNETGQVRVDCYFNFRESHKRFKGSFGVERINYYVTYGGVMERAIGKALVSLGATQEDYADYIRNETQILNSYKTVPDGYIGGFKGLYYAFAYILGFKSLEKDIEKAENKL